MTADPEMPDANAYRARAFDALEAGDHHTAYRWAKGWVGAGGAGHPEPWLVYVAEALMTGQAKRGTHAIDLPLRHWVTGRHDRAALDVAPRLHRARSPARPENGPARPAGGRRRPAPLDHG